jgi:hypothetical protein
MALRLGSGTPTFRVGSASVTRVYLGGQQVWPTATPPAERSPNTVNLLYRWRADSVTGVADGAAVASWPALAGSVPLAQATAGNRPTYVASGIGGKPSVRFTTSAQQWLSATITAQAQPHTIVFVHKLNRTAAPNQQLWHAGNQLITTPPSYDAFGGVDLQRGTVTTSPTVLTWVADTASSRIVQNGVVQGAVGSNGTAGIGTALRIGANSGGTQYADMDLSEVFVYSGAKTAADLAVTHSYVQDRYGITVADYTP